MVTGVSNKVEAVDKLSCHNKCFSPHRFHFSERSFSSYLGLPPFRHQSGTCQRGHDVIECGQRGEEQEQGLVGESSE